MGSKALYELGGYSGKNYSNVYFTTFTFHGAGGSSSENFQNQYHHIFDPYDEFPGKYGYQLAGPHAVLSHDAVEAYTTEVQQQSNKGINDLLTNVIENMSNNTFSGAAGSTTLSDADTYMDRHMYAVCVNSDGHTQELIDYQPSIDADKPGNPQIVQGFDACK